MDLFLLHFVLLSWFSAGAVARWVHGPLERILAAVAVGWANLVATAFILSCFHRLGHSGAFLALSLSLAVALTCIAWLRPAETGPAQPESPVASLWLSLPAHLTLIALAIGSAWTAAHYLPSTPSAIAYALPRSLLQLGNGSIFPLQVADTRQVLPPFNHGLLHTWALIYRVPLQALNFFNLLGWILGGIAIYRLCRVVGWNANASLAAAWCGLVATPVVAQAATSDNGLPAASALVAALGFLLDWRKNPRLAPAVFGGLLAGLAAGTSLGAFLVVFFLGLLAWSSSAIPRENRAHAVGGLVFGILPFAANLVLSFGHGFGARIASLLRLADGDSFLSPRLLLPLWRKPSVLHGAVEETVGLGVTGLLCFAAALICAGRRSRYGRTAFVLGVVAWVWVVSLGLASLWFTVDADQRIVAVLLAAPAVAAFLHHTTWSRPVWRTISVLFAAGALWSAYLYLGYNVRRPLAPLLDPTTIVAPVPSPVPRLLDYRLSLENRVNFTSDGEDDLLLVLMSRQQTQRYSTHEALVPDAYNVVSRASLSRNRPLRELPQGSAYVLIPFDRKPTAGVEFLGTIGLGPLSRDYLGISGAANERSPIVTNHTVLLSLACLDFSPTTMRLRAAVTGLNPRDNARLEISGIASEGERMPLAQIDRQGEHTFAAPANLRQMVLRILSTNDGRELGSAALGADRAPFAESDSAPANPDALFRVQLVSMPPDEHLRVGPGLTAPEGPFPQWDLPVFRWARAETFTLRVPESRKLGQIRLSFSARLHLRHKAIMEVLCNGQKLRQVDFDDPSTWHEVTFSFPARTGENIIEFRDAELPLEPDWAGYLERYPDVKRFVEAAHQLPKEGALEHYKSCGKAEGRIMNFLPVPRPAPDAFFFMFRSLRVEGLPR